VFAGHQELRISENSYDWLGSGIYFWANNSHRALEYAEFLKKLFLKRGLTLPRNAKGKDLLMRKRDCMIINFLHHFNEKVYKKPAYNTVLGVFEEGKPLYANSGIKLKTHIQLCVRSPESIIGYFRPKL